MTRADYAPSEGDRTADILESSGIPGGLVASVTEGSAADKAGIVEGVVITAVDGEPLHDELDWNWFADGDDITIEGYAPSAVAAVFPDVDEAHLDAGGGFFFDAHLSRSSGEPWGIEFAHALFDGMRTCKNSCEFCFIRMLPDQLRSPLYLRDDDYRLSFLQGNFVSLTNMDDEDVTRVVDQGLFPLHVSVHAISPDVRRSLIGKHEARGREVLEQLLTAGIPIHTQIVLVPGLNDGEELDRTLDYLVSHESMLSCGVVPLGYTKFQEHFDHGFENAEAARAVIEQIEPLRLRLKAERGRCIVHLADEFYLNAGVDFPAADFYDGFEQYEDGIGMCRSFIDDWNDAISTLAPKDIQHRSPQPRGETEIACLSGEAFAPLLSKLIESAAEQGRFEAGATVVAVRNDFFGGNVDVTGLLTAGDILRTLGEYGTGERFTHIIVPDAIFNADGLTLDGYTADYLQQHSEPQLVVVSCEAEDLVETLLSLQS